MSSQTRARAVAAKARDCIEWFRHTWRTQPAQTIAVLALVLVIVDFVRPLSLVQLALLIVALVALSPWSQRVPSLLATTFESWEVGSVKFKFRRVTDEVAAAGLLAEPSDAKGKPAYEIIYNEDPALALAGLRIALEKRLKDMARIANQDETRPLHDVILGLARGGALTVDQIEALNDLLPLLNRAVHAEDTGKEAAEWAMSEGPKLIAGLEKRAKQLGASPELLWGNTAPTGIEETFVPTREVRGR
jgi:hypothetical protein